MLKRMILMLAVTGGVIGLLGFVKFRQIQEAMGQAAAFQPPTGVRDDRSSPRKTRGRSTLSAIGTMAAVQGVTVSADLPGIVESIAFESGASVTEGALLVQLDTKQEKAQLAAVEAANELAKLNFERLHDLVEEGAITRAEYDRAAAEQKESDAKVAEIRAAIARKTIRAPFSGVLGIRQVNLGQYLSPGSPVVPLQSLDPIYVNSRRAAAGRRGDCDRPYGSHHNRRPRRRGIHGTNHRNQRRSRRSDTQHSDPDDAELIPKESSTRECSFKRKFWWEHRDRCLRTGIGDQLCTIRRLRVHRFRSQERERTNLSRRPSTICESRTGARRPDFDPVRHQSRRRNRHVQARSSFAMAPLSSSITRCSRQQARPQT